MQSSRAPAFLSRAALAPALILSIGFSVTGCVDTVGQARVEPAAAPQKVARRDGVSPRGARVALVGVEGAPQGVAEQFAAAFGQSAGAYEIQTVDVGKADYIVRPYLTAYAAAGGTTRISYVFDVFDKGKRRVQRLTDEVGVRGASADPWSLADSAALQAVADRSAGDLADALTNTPEAVAAASIASAAGSNKPRAGETKVSQGGTTTAVRTAAEANEAPAARMGFAASR